MTDVRLLDILLHGRRVGTITRLDGDRSIFTFDEAYAADERRDTLSQSFRDPHGALFTDDNRAYQTRLQPFFSNLLPEGALRDFLAQRTGISSAREFQLLAQLGADLPGAVRAIPSDGLGAPSEVSAFPAPAATRPMRFSLAGVQLKFSALKNKGRHGGLTIPLAGEGGGWIVKLPSTRAPELPENEYAMMTLASRVGIEIPDIDLVAIKDIEGLPEGIQKFGDTAYVIRRFDRGPDGPVHIEDFAQVYRLYPEEKYEHASYRAILSALATVTDAGSVDQFVRRLTFSVLIGNGDMHLKNWSLIYPDRRTPRLSPAYDLLSTIPYLPRDEAALKFRRSKAWASFTYEELAKMADKARLAEASVVNAARETVALFDEAWERDRASLRLSGDILDQIARHRASLAI